MAFALIAIHLKTKAGAFSSVSFGCFRYSSDLQVTTNQYEELPTTHTHHPLLPPLSAVKCMRCNVC